VLRFLLPHRFSREEHLFSSTEGRRSWILSLSINPTFQVALLLGGYSTSASLQRPPFLHITSTYWKHASVTSSLDLPLVIISTFFEGVMVSPDPVQVEDSSGSHGALSSLQAPGSTLQRLDVRLRLRPGGFFFFGYPCTLHDFIAVTSSLCFDMASFLPLRLHVDRGLARHGYPWVATGQGPRGPCQVTQPARSLDVL
jgi:hypothetical protein